MPLVDHLFEMGSTGPISSLAYGFLRSDPLMIRSTSALFPSLEGIDEGVVGDIVAAAGELHIFVKDHSKSFTFPSSWVQGLDGLSIADGIELSLNLRSEEAVEGKLRFRAQTPDELLRLLCVLQLAEGNAAAAAAAAKHKYGSMVPHQQTNHAQQNQLQPPPFRRPVRLGGERSECENVMTGKRVGAEKRGGEDSFVYPSDTKRKKTTTMAVAQRTIVVSETQPKSPFPARDGGATPSYIAATATAGALLPPPPPSPYLGSNSWVRPSDAAARLAKALATVMPSASMPVLTNENAHQSSSAAFVVPPSPRPHQHQQPLSGLPDNNWLMTLLALNSSSSQTADLCSTMGGAGGGAVQQQQTQPSFQQLLQQFEQSMAASQQPQPQLIPGQLMLTGPDNYSTAANGQLMTYHQPQNTCTIINNKSEESRETSRLFAEMADKVYRLGSPRRTEVLETLKTVFHLLGV